MPKFMSIHPALAIRAGAAALLAALLIALPGTLLGSSAGAAQAAAGRKMTAAPPSHRVSHRAPPAELQAIRAAGEKDRRHMMELLGIKKLRPGASFVPGSPHAPNYDEAKAGPTLPLPDPLRLEDGKPVTSVQMWWRERRPQIVDLFDRDVLGRLPAHLPAVDWQAVSTTRDVIGGVPVITKKLVGRVISAADPAIPVNIRLILTTPADATEPVPVILELAFAESIADEFDPVWNSGRATPENVWEPTPTWQQQVLDRGWAYAMLSPTSFQADNGAGLTAGIIGLMNHGQPRHPDDWGALRAWAWGASRALDYFATDPAVDAHQVGIMGHSRMGKAALVAMAYDRRFAIAYISSSGEGGAKLYRRNFGEPIGNLAGAGEYQWMAGNFLKYDGPLTVADLPVDAHELIALCAPRPVFIGAGAATPDEDGWVDPEGMFDAEVAAGPVYRLLGKKGLGVSVFPPIETALTDGDLAFRQHAGGHTPAPDWQYFLEFAGRYLHVRTAPASTSNPVLPRVDAQGSAP